MVTNDFNASDVFYRCKYCGEGKARAEFSNPYKFRIKMCVDCQEFKCGKIN